MLALQSLLYLEFLIELFMKVNTHINMVILDDYHSYFNDMAKDKRLPDEIKLIVYNNHFKNSKELIKVLVA